LRSPERALSSSKNFLCIRINRASGFIGWAVLLDTQMRDNKYFGNMRLGSIVDCLALPKSALAVMQAATQFLEQRGVDLIISNQSHHAWGGALKSSGFLETRSNFIFGASRPLAELLSPFRTIRTSIPESRGRRRTSESVNKEVDSTVDLMYHELELPGVHSAKTNRDMFATCEAEGFRIPDGMAENQILARHERE